jgi:hypothetical protein
MRRPTILILCGILLGCAATAVVTKPAGVAAAAVASVEQYCTTTRDFNNVGAVDQMVQNAGRDGWALIGVYRATPLGARHEDYLCFRRAP